MKKSILSLKNIRLKNSQIHKLRGFIGNLFSDYDLIHNHDPITGKLIYRYPLIQFKIINGCPAIVAITDEAVRLFSQIFMQLDHVVIDNVEIPVFEKDLRVEQVAFGFSSEKIRYQFDSPWIALNQKNYRHYRELGVSWETVTILERALIGNLLSMSKSLGHWLEPEQRLTADFNLSDKPVQLKGKTLIGFYGVFKTNFHIPDYLGIGKSVSRGFGSVKKAEQI